MPQLHYSLDPESKKNKELLVFGYVRTSVINLIPDEITKLFKLFYDEALQWNIDCSELSKFVRLNNNNNDDNKTERKIYCGEWFECEGIKMRWMLDPIATAYTHYGKNVISFFLQIIGENIQILKLYISIYCPQNGATFKRVIDNIHFTEDDNGKYWTSTDFGMLLDYKQFDEISFNHYIDVLCVINKENGKEYHKPISMKKICDFTWNIDGLLLNRMQTAFCQQMFYSDLFDTVNNNWCLCLFPMGQRLNTEPKERKTGLVLRLFKCHSKISTLMVKLTIKNTYNHNESVERTLILSNRCGFDELYTALKSDLFPSNILSKVETIAIIVNIEILVVNGDENQQNWEKFGIQLT